MPEVPAVLVVGFLPDPVDHFQCLGTAAVAALEEKVELVLEEKVELVAVVQVLPEEQVVQVLPEEQEEEHVVPWVRPCGR